MKKTLISLAVASLISTSLFADAEIDALKAQLAALEEKTDALLEETSNLQTGFNFNVVDTDFSHNGMGAAASKVYNSKSPLSIGGYGEMFYANPDNNTDAFADVYRFVPYFGYKFNDKIVLNVELEVEHGGTSGGGKVVVEFMYLDFLLDDAFNVQIGHLLVPMGLTNLRHEPTLFNTVQRPETERQIIPSTWHENGIIAYGNIGESGLTYNLGLVNAIDYSANYTAANGIASDTTTTRDGRIGASKNGTMERVAAIGRLDYMGTPGLLVGGSVYYGAADQGKTSGSTALSYEGHVTYENSGFKGKALYGSTTVDGLNDNGLYPNALEEASGYYVNLEYDVLNIFNSEYRLPVFVQYDDYNKIEKLADGTNPDAGEQITTVGINFFPHEQVVLKLDYAMKDYADNADEDFNTISVGIGFIF